MISAVLATNFRTHKSILNHNNEIGLCETLMLMPEDTEFLVVEAGMRGLGEIELISKYAEPDFAVITNVGTAHIGRLGSLENIAKAKCEIIKYLKKDGVLIAFDDELTKNTCKWKGNAIYYGKDYKITETKENSTKFIYGETEYELPVSGEFNVINSIAAIEIGKLAGISEEKIKQGLLNYKPVGERGKIIEIDKNIKIISDCYNANPDSMKASINSVLSVYPDSEITLVLGDMGELGEYENQMHEEIGEFLSDKSFYQLVTVGEKAKLIANSTKNKNIKIESCMNNKEAADFLKKNLSKNAVILLKASRSMKLEEIAEALQKVKPKKVKISA